MGLPGRRRGVVNIVRTCREVNNVGAYRDSRAHSLTVLEFGRRTANEV